MSADVQPRKRKDKRRKRGKMSRPWRAPNQATNQPPQHLPICAGWRSKVVISDLLTFFFCLIIDFLVSIFHPFYTNFLGKNRIFGISKDKNSSAQIFDAAGLGRCRCHRRLCGRRTLHESESQPKCLVVVYFHFPRRPS